MSQRKTQAKRNQRNPSASGVSKYGISSHTKEFSIKKNKMQAGSLQNARVPHLRNLVCSMALTPNCSFLLIPHSKTVMRDQIMVFLACLW